MREVVNDLIYAKLLQETVMYRENMKSAQQILHLGCRCLMFGIFLFRKMMKRPLERMMILIQRRHRSRIDGA